MTLYVGACLPSELIWCTLTLEILIIFLVALNFLEIFSKTVMEETKDLILTPYDTIGTVIGGNRTDCFLSWFAYVAVSKSRHHLLCSATWKGQKHSKIPY